MLELESWHCRGSVWQWRNLSFQSSNKSFQGHTQWWPTVKSSLQKSVLHWRWLSLWRLLAAISLWVTLMSRETLYKQFPPEQGWQCSKGGHMLPLRCHCSEGSPSIWGCSQPASIWHKRRYLTREKRKEHFKSSKHQILYHQTFNDFFCT